jgi:hypothetical protein
VQRYCKFVLSLMQASKEEVAEGQLMKELSLFRRRVTNVTNLEAE